MREIHSPGALKPDSESGEGASLAVLGRHREAVLGEFRATGIETADLLCNFDSTIPYSGNVEQVS